MFRDRDTYYGIKDGEHVSSRTDYQMIAAGQLDRVTKCYTDDYAAKQLQLIPDYRLRDHVPLVVECDVNLQYTGEETVTRHINV